MKGPENTSGCYKIGDYSIKIYLSEQEDLKNDIIKITWLNH